MIDSFINWLDFTKSIALAGLLIALVNSYFTWQNRRLVLRQELRRVPRLLPSLVHGFYQLDKVGGKIYAFHVTVRNQSDNSNAISEVDLAISYLTKHRVQMIVRFRANDPRAVNFVKGQGETLSIPASISAHHTVSGWLRFYMPASMLDEIEIETHRLIFTDTHLETASITPNLLREYRDET